jgi:hypothetical protein
VHGLLHGFLAELRAQIIKTGSHGHNFNLSREDDLTILLFGHSLVVSYVKRTIHDLVILVA